MTLEDETGTANLIVRSHVYDRYRAAARRATLLKVHGYVERQGSVTHVMAIHLIDLNNELTGYAIRSRAFR